MNVSAVAQNRRTRGTASARLRAPAMVIYLSTPLRAEKLATIRRDDSYQRPLVYGADLIAHGYGAGPHSRRFLAAVEDASSRAVAIQGTGDVLVAEEFPL